MSKKRQTILYFSVAISLLITVTALAQSPVTEMRKNPIGLLPDGSVLQNVLLPRYDTNKRLVSDVRAKTMTLIDKEKIQGSDVLIRFYDEERRIKGKVTLKETLINQTTSLLHAKENVKITHDRLYAEGTGLTYAYQKGQGFLRGPALTSIAPEPIETSATWPHFGVDRLLTALTTPLLSQTATPNYVSSEELTKIKDQSKSQRTDVEKANTEATQKIESDRKSTKTSVQVARASAKANGVEIETDKQSANTEPLKVAPAKGATIINCDGGMYFDTQAGILVYLDNVRVKDTRFKIHGAKELKIIFEKQNNADQNAGANFDNVKKIIATGAVRIFQNAINGKEPVEASGALLTYDVKTGEIIINGGYPWVKQGDFFARAKQPNLTLRLMQDGSFSTRGKWEMGGNLNLR